MSLKLVINLLCYRRYILMRLIQDINEFKACYKSIMLSYIYCKETVLLSYFYFMLVLTIVLHPF